MPSIVPFHGLRYTAAADTLANLLSPPYDVISSDEQATLAALSLHNAVHLELPADAPGQPGSRYRLAADRLAQWRQAGVVQADPRPAYYLSETQFEHGGQTVTRRDLLASLAVEPWSTGHVLPHEDTMAGPKQDRLALLASTHLQLSPIWLLHREPLSALDDAWQAAASTTPSVEVTWRDERHRLWVLDDPERVEAITAAFAASGPLYIADGHHRYETSLAFRSDVGTSVPGATGILSAITWAGDPGLVVLPTHRLLRGLAGRLDLEDVETRWADVFHVEYYPVWEDAPPEQVDALMQQLASTGRLGAAFGVLGLGHRDLFGLLELRGRQAPADALPADRSEAWKTLDVSLLHALLIDHLVAETGQPRDEVLRYTRDPHAAFAAVREGAASAAFFLNPTPVDGVLAVADARDRMPEKSTYFYPKPPAGLVMRELDR